MPCVVMETLAMPTECNKLVLQELQVRRPKIASARYPNIRTPFCTSLPKAKVS